MPIGSSKIGVLGAGLVPGGCQTFNASGTFTVPPGVTKVNITGKGGTGNPGNAGNAGNAGNPGTGGGGGAGGLFNSSNCQCTSNGPGGWAFKSFSPNGSIFVNSVPQPWLTGRGNAVAGAGNPGADGSAGTAGSAGSAGNPGNPGNASSGLCKTFPGGTGGNAGVAGAAGNAGSAGGGGGGGATGPSGGAGGSGGSGGGGAGGNGGTQTFNPAPCGKVGYVGGGAGAGITNNGEAGANRTCAGPIPSFNPLRGATGGNSACLSGPIPSQPTCKTMGTGKVPNNVTPNTMGGSGALQCGVGGPALSLVYGSAFAKCLSLCNSVCTIRGGLPKFCPAPLRPTLFRAGAGGGTTPPYVHTITITGYFGGGGGGGGRGGAGGAGGTSPTPSGSAATPASYNCLPVTPGGSYPITVGGPAGGQVVISWNPQ